MTARVIAWVVVLGIAYAVYGFVSSWKSPWSLTSVQTPITKVMPAMTHCKEDCLK